MREKAYIYVVLGIFVSLGAIAGVGDWRMGEERERQAPVCRPDPMMHQSEKTIRANDMIEGWLFGSVYHRCTGKDPTADYLMRAVQADPAPLNCAVVKWVMEGR